MASVSRGGDQTVSQSRVPPVIDAFARGEIVVVTDDDDRENEGDLILAAVHATPEKLHFIIRRTYRIVCGAGPGETGRPPGFCRPRPYFPADRQGGRRPDAFGPP